MDFFLSVSGIDFEMNFSSIVGNFFQFIQRFSDDGNDVIGVSCVKRKMTLWSVYTRTAFDKIMFHSGCLEFKSPARTNHSQPLVSVSMSTKVEA